MSANNPYDPIQGSSGHEIDDDIRLPEGQTRGMTGQAGIVGALMIVQGVMDLAAAGFAAFYALLFPQMMNAMQQQQGGQAGQAPAMPAGALETIMFGAGAVAVGLVVIGLLLIYAGIGVMRFQQRTIAMISLALGLLTLFTCYCFPTSLLLAGYGFVFLLNQPVSLAFDLRGRGHAVRRIQQAFLRLP